VRAIAVGRVLRTAVPDEVPMSGPHDPSDREGALARFDAPAEPRRLVARLIVGLAALFAAFAVVLAVLREPITALSEVFVDRFGLAGVALGALLCDLTAAPKEPVLVLGVTGGLAFWTIAATISVTTMVAGITGWALGRRFGRVPWIERRLARTPVGPFLHRHGARAVAFAAVVPFPFATMTWAAGAVGLPFRTFLVGCLFRIPKSIVSFALAVGGAHLGTWLAR
jgi:uncharacterized membrane protein YdjX (TVP38/TMEM64 family)